MAGETEAFGSLLRAHRLAVGLTQAALAEAAGLSERGIQNIERGVRLPYPRTVEQLAAALHLSPAQASRLSGLAIRLPNPRGRLGGPPEAPTGEVKPATAICARIANLPLLQARLAPAVLRAVVSGWQDTVRREVERHGGALERVDESGVVAVFGIPTRQDHAPAALHAALATRDALAAYEAEVAGAWSSAPSHRIGVDGGVVEAHLDASGWHIVGGDGTLLDSAARLERHARPGGIWVGEAARKAAGDRFVWRALGPLAAASGRASELLSARGRYPSSVPRQFPLVGRRAEIAQLGEAWSKARSGRGQIVALVGEAGIGKTRLLHELTHQLEGESALWLAASCFAHAEATAYAPFRDMVRRYLAVPDTASTTTVRVHVSERLAALGLDKGAAPYLQYVLGAGIGDPLLRRLPPELLRARAIDAVVRLVLAAADARPMAILLEDVHWIDSGSEAILAALASALGTRHLLLVVTSRPEGLHPWANVVEYPRRPGPSPSTSITATMRAIARQPHATRLDLGRLSMSDGHRLVEQTAGRPFPPEVVRLVAERAAGNPLFVVALTRALADPVSSDEPGSVQTVGIRPARLADLPSTVRDVLLARVDRLPTDLKRVLQLASVVGPEVDLRLLVDIAEPDLSIESALVRLEDLGFLYLSDLGAERRYTFDHVLMQAAVYESLLPVTSQRWHQRTGRAIERLYAGRLAEQYEMLAHHFAASDDDEKAVEYLTLASQKASAASAVADANAYFEATLARIDRLPDTVLTRARRVALVLEQFPVMLLLGRLPTYHALLREIEPLVAGLDDQGMIARYYCSLGACEWACGEIQAGRTTLLRAADLTPTGDDGLLGMVQVVLGRCELDLGHYDAALTAHLAAMPRVDRHLSLHWFRWARTGAMWVYGYQGRWEEARTVASEVLRASEELGDPSMQAEILLNLATLSVDQGDPERAADEARRALDLAPTPAERLMAEATLGSVECHLGRPENGLEALERTTDALQVSGLIPAAINGSVWLGAALTVAGRPDQARAVLTQQSERAEQAGMRFQQARAERLLGEIALAASDDVTAAHHLERSIRLLADLGAASELALARAAYGWLLAGRGELAASRNHLTWSLATLTRLGTRGASDRIRADLEAHFHDTVDV